MEQVYQYAETKRCGRCEQEKPLGDFELMPPCGSRRKWYRQSFCIPCHRQYSKEYYEKNKARRLYQSKNLTLEEYEEKLASQKTCAICGIEMTRVEGLFKKKRSAASLDHDHKTGRNREFLCMHRNLLLGYAEDDPARLRKAAEYLEKHSC